MTESRAQTQAERTTVVALALEEARRLCGEGSAADRLFWQNAASHIAAIQCADEDFETAYALKTGLGRLLSERPAAFPPTIERLFIVMERWRRTITRESPQDQGFDAN